LTIIIFISSCGQTPQKQKEIFPPDFDNEFILDTTIKFENVRDVAYGYNFSYPKSFTEVIDTIGQVDSLILYSKDRLAKIKFFIEGDIKKDKSATDKNEKTSFEEYFSGFTSNRHWVTQNSKIIKTSYRYKNSEYGNPAKFLVLGERDTTEFISETELSEIPISGDLTFKNFIMLYPKSKKAYYRPIALTIAKNFGQ
jgi:hypothetical protein